MRRETVHLAFSLGLQSEEDGERRPFRILVISRGLKSGHSGNSSYRAGVPSGGTPTVPSFL